MRRTLLFVLLLTACASRDGLIEGVVHDCSAGQDVSVDLLLNMPSVMTESTADNLTVSVTVGNNSTRTIEVKAIRVEPGFTAQERYALGYTFREVNQVIEPGDDEQFDLPVRGQAGTRPIDRPGGSDTIEVVLSVYMAGGDKYRCIFEVPAPK